MSDNRMVTPPQSIGATVISLFGFIFFLYFSLGFLHSTRGIVFRWISGQVGHSLKHWFISGVVSLTGILLSLLITYKAEWFSQWVTPNEGGSSVKLSSPVVFLRISLIALSLLVLFSCIPSILMVLAGHYEASSNSVGTVIFWNFESGNFSINVLRVTMAVLVLFFNRHLAEWSLGE